MALHESYKWAIMWRVPQPRVLPPYNLHGRIIGSSIRSNEMIYAY
jgi:hypothetical protein